MNAIQVIELFHKTGSTGIIGATSSPLSTIDGPDARGKSLAFGRYSTWVFELIYKRSANDGLFYLEVALENQDNLYSPLSYVRLDTGVVVSSTAPLSLTTDTRFLIAVQNALGLSWIRPVCFAKGGPSPKDELIFRTLERQA